MNDLTDYATNNQRLEPAPPTQVCAYLRVSSARQQDAYGPKIQLGQIQDYCTRNNMKIAKILEDQCSGVVPLFEREQGRQLLILPPNINIIVVGKWDRIGRGETDLDSSILDPLNRLRKNGKDIKVAAEGEIAIGDGFEGKILGAMAEYHAWRWREQLRKHTREGRKAKFESGQVANGGHISLGFKQEGQRKTARMMIDPEYAPMIKGMFERRAAGESVWNILEWMNENYEPKSRAKRFYQSAVYRMLDNPKYRGEFSYQGITHQREDLRIVSDELWLAAQDAKRAPYKRRPEGVKNPLPTLKLKCECGMSMYYYHDPRNRDTHPGWYKCVSRGKVQYYDCRAKAIKADRVIAAVESFRSDVLTPDNLLDWLMEEQERKAEEFKLRDIEYHLTEAALVEEIAQRDSLIKRLSIVALDLIPTIEEGLRKTNQLIAQYESKLKELDPMTGQVSFILPNDPKQQRAAIQAILGQEIAITGRFIKCKRLELSCQLGTLVYNDGKVEPRPNREENFVMEWDPAIFEGDNVDEVRQPDSISTQTGNCT